MAMYGQKLSEKVKDYQKTEQGWKELEKGITLFIYEWAQKKRNIGDEWAADFLLSFMPRIPALVRNYNHYDCPFEHYVTVCLEWHVIKFQTSNNKKIKKEEIYWQTTGHQDLWEACQPKPAYSVDEKVPKNLPPFMLDYKFKKRFLKYILYHVYRINYDMLETYADYLGMEKAELNRLIRKADELIRKKKERREAIMEKKRTYFIDHRYQEMKLKLTEDLKNREEIQNRITSLDHKIHSLMIRAARIKMTPSTEDVGKLTGSSSSTTGRDIKIIGDFLSTLAKKKGLFPSPFSDSPAPVILKP
jgi:hypothetical protein